MFFLIQCYGKGDIQNRWFISVKLSVDNLFDYLDIGVNSVSRFFYLIMDFNKNKSII